MPKGERLETLQEFRRLAPSDSERFKAYVQGLQSVGSEEGDEDNSNTENFSDMSAREGDIQANQDRKHILGRRPKKPARPKGPFKKGEHKRKKNFH